MDEGKLFPNHQDECPACGHEFGWDSLFKRVKKRTAKQLDSHLYKFRCVECGEDLELEISLLFTIHWG